MTGARLTFVGPPMRLDRYLRDRLGQQFGRRGVTVLLRADEVRVNGRRARKGLLLRQGDEITLPEHPLAHQPLVPTPVALAIVHCEAELVAIDKPPGMPSTGGMSEAASVASALLDRFPEMAAIDPVRAAGLVHRLDTGTSGLLVAARTQAAYQRLRSALAAKTIVKEYLAVVAGHLTGSGRVALPLTRHPRSRKRMVVARAGHGWHAETEYRALVHADDATLVHLRMRTGVTHQLRAHLAQLGHPVIGDRRYGRLGTAISASCASWHYLHALRMSSDDPEVLGVELATPFPRHWTPLFARLEWPLDAIDPPAAR
jgi:23S rRNA pseudouridine1911/1915/1917 synthase